MEIRRATFGATVRLGFVLSTVAVLVAVLAESIGDVNAWGMAATVAVAGFATSWSLTGRVARTVPADSRHRVTVVRLRHPVA